MSSKKGKRNLGNKHFPIAESVSIALKIQLDKFLCDENDTELKFPTFLSAQERGFIHETVAKLGLKSKSRGKGVNRYITIYKRIGSTIIQNDAKLILDSNMRCSITELFNTFPITSKEKDDLSCCPEKERSPQLAHKPVGQLNNGVAQVPSTTYNPDLVKFREKLPVYEQRQELLNAITHNQVIIVAGATGCGKTTQLPQLVLEHCQQHKQPARIYCTQPRRLSAVSVAERVSLAFCRQVIIVAGATGCGKTTQLPQLVLEHCQQHKQPARIYCTQPRRLSAVSVAERVSLAFCRQVIIVAGATGCGKTTQLPQLVLEHCQQHKQPARIYCTQPRRLSAVSVAERVSIAFCRQVIIVAGATGCGKTTQLPQLVLEHCQQHKQPARIYCTQPRRLSAVSVAERVSLAFCRQVIIVAGATGCGKTTQLPQLVLEHCQQHKQPARIYCTQPRRLSAVSVAERVAYERMEKIGQSIGYQIRLESRVSPRTVLTYCTNGLLLRTLMCTDTQLAGVTHVFVDEVHERDKFSDFLLIALRDALPRCKDLKLILMSATMDTQIFSRYFNNCPVITIPGRLHEVQRYYLEDILKLTQYRTKKMVQAERELKHKLKSGQSYWSHLEGQKQTEESKDSKEEKEVTLEPALQADMDEFLEECFKEGSLDSFCQILYMYLSEGVPVQCAQSGSGRSGLMAAARHGLTDTARQMLQIGADPTMKDKNGKTARDYALEHGHTECAQLLASLSIPEDIRDTEDNAADHFLLDVYHHTVSEDFIDHDLMLALIKHIHINLPKGSILVFLPGYDDIVTLRDLVQNCTEMNSLKYQIFTLHSNMQTLDQKKVFNPLPNARKIIISTNIAETSITIDDVVYVVDSCKVKEKYYESSAGVCSLQCVWTSRAGCQQRAGRAGRTKPGHCFHMCSKRRFQTLPLNSIPEILRVPLQELCLHTKLLASGNTPIADFLSKALEPPSFLAVRNAVTLLKTIGALTPMEDLTEIGQHLLDLTVEPKLGKMLLYACVMKCLDPILTIVCSLANKEPFQISMNPENRKRGSMARKEFAADCYSDHMALLRAFQAWQSARANGSERAFCAKNLICGATMEMIVGYRAQLLAQLRALCLVKARGSGDIKDVNLNSEKWHVVKAVLVSGLYPSIARVDRDSGSLRTSKEVKVAFHPSSTLHRGDGITNAHKSVQNLPTDWVVFEEISRAGRFCFIRCNTLVTPLTVSLFGGPLRLPPGALTQRANPPGLSSDSDSEADENNSSPDTAVLTLDDWMAFTADASDAISVYYLRQKLCALVIRRMSNPAKPMTPLDEQILSTVVHVLSAEEKNVGLNQPSGIGQRPKPLTVDAPNWRTRAEEEQYRHDGKYYPQYQQEYQQNYYQNPYYQNQRNGLRAGWRAEAPAHSAPSHSAASHSAAPPGARARSPPGSALLANIEKAGARARYFVARDDTGEQGNGLPFAPATAAKLMKIKQEGHQVVVFVARESAARFVGCAALGDAGLEWLCTNQLPYHAVRHVCNSLAGNSRVVCSADGAELCAGSARALSSLSAAAPAPAHGSLGGGGGAGLAAAARARRRPPPQTHTHKHKHAQ